jgi:hypothetical protein
MVYIDRRIFLKEVRSHVSLFQQNILFCECIRVDCTQL